MLFVNFWIFWIFFKLQKGRARSTLDKPFCALPQGTPALLSGQSLVTKLFRQAVLPWHVLHCDNLACGRAQRVSLLVWHCSSLSSVQTVTENQDQGFGGSGLPSWAENNGCPSPTRPCCNQHVRILCTKIPSKDAFVQIRGVRILQCLVTGRRGSALIAPSPHLLDPHNSGWKGKESYRAHFWAGEWLPGMLRESIFLSGFPFQSRFTAEVSQRINSCRKCRALFLLHSIDLIAVPLIERLGKCDGELNSGFSLPLGPDLSERSLLVWRELFFLCQFLWELYSGLVRFTMWNRTLSLPLKEEENSECVSVGFLGVGS